jgi:hypothetical protein
MKLTFVSLVMILAAAVSIAAQVKYSTYSNARFGYSIDYPRTILTSTVDSDNGDGRTFRSKDGKAVMRVWGSYAVTGMTMQEEYEKAFEDLDEKPSYAKVKDREFVFSGIKKGRIFYQRTVSVDTPDGEVRQSFTIEYPRAQKAKWDPIVTRISRSFKAMVLGSGR